MSWCIYLTHPEVKIDPDVPVPEWGLSDVGRERALKATELPFAPDLKKVVSSAETKAVETAGIFAEKFKIPQTSRVALHENDRSATGFLPPNEFEQVADQFFAEPEISVRGWERACDAQQRIVEAVSAELAGTSPDQAVLFAGHGAAGTLLMCHLMGVAISRDHDQKRGGSWYRFERDWLTSQAGHDLSWIEV
ncbi:MAG: phosphoglycerate mutase family protein [Roseibium sp.]|uniref:histidine phosphatase family protein n=1 Tax=Roseibium sp. TaxID=1936156 RepID=UPI00260C1738|nr:histidine phosphatase family protein [Roseibium sp.]MCV0429372.1 phosphoglycerate mutase family protein [Roseibium sp.]